MQLDAITPAVTLLCHLSDTPTDPNACWLWQGARNTRSYGIVQVGKRQFRVSRIVWEMVNGPIPAGLFVCHHCDTPACWNPRHLWLGTAGDNNRDRHAKGRDGDGGRSHPEARPRGERHANARLTEADVRRIRQRLALGVSQASLGREYGVTIGAIWRIAHGLNWRHVP